MKGIFAEMRRGGFFDIGLSVPKLAKAMVEVLSALPSKSPPSKEFVVRCLGVLGHASSTRDLNAAWALAKRQILGECPGKYCLDGKVLRHESAMATAGSPLLPRRWECRPTRSSATSSSTGAARNPDVCYSPPHR